MSTTPISYKKAATGSDSPIPIHMGGKDTGIVKWFNTKSGFGFIESLDSEEDIFVHFSALGEGEYNYLVQGEYVEFNTVTSDKYKCQASNVTGIRCGKLMCETRRDAKREYESKHVDDADADTEAKAAKKPVYKAVDAFKKPVDAFKKATLTSTAPDKWTLVNKNKDNDVRVPRQKSVGRKA